MLEIKRLHKGDERMRQTTLFEFGLRIEGQTTLEDFGLVFESKEGEK